LLFRVDASCRSPAGRGAPRECGFAIKDQANALTALAWSLIANPYIVIGRARK
jgi:hypothetical protein